MTAKVEGKELALIVSHLKEGKSQGWIAKEVGRSKQTISRISRAEGFLSDVTATKRASEARRDYALAERLELLNEGFQRARDILPTIKEARELQAWMVAVGTAIDKRRLEDGQVTDRTESHKGLNIEEEFRKLDAKFGGCEVE